MPRRDLGYGVTVVALATLWPFVDFLVQNQGEYVSLVRVAVAALVATLVGLAILGLLVRRHPARVRPVSVIVAWTMLSFLNFDVLFDPWLGSAWGAGFHWSPFAQFLLWLVLTAVVARLLWKVAFRPLAQRFVVLFLLVATGAQVVSVVTYELDDRETASGELPVDETPFIDRPNIYHFILDQYPRADVAREWLALDLDPSVRDLEARGFWVGEHSYTAYPNTLTALPSLLERSYVFTATEDVEAGVAAMTAPLLGDARVIRELEAAGYQYIYAGTGHVYWGSCRGDGIDVCLTPARPGLLGTEVDQALLRRTPLSMLLPTPVTATRPEDVVAALEARRSELSEPFFLFAHLLTPHEPFEYASDCSLRDRPAERRTRSDYANEIDCLNRELLRVVDEIRADDPTAVILLQADHGTSFDVKWGRPLSEWTTDLLRQRFAVFDARLGPAGCPPPPDGPSLHINTYPWLLACLRGEAPEYLEPRAFLWNYDFDGPVEEIDDPFAAFGEPPDNTASSGDDGDR